MAREPQHRSPKKWLSEIERAKKVLGRALQETDPIARAYNNEWPTSWEHRDIHSNYIMRGTDAYIEHLYVHKPTIDILIKKGLDAKTQRGAKAIVNYIFTRNKLTPKAQAWLKDAIIRGIGWFKVGYHAENIDEDELLLLKTDADAENKQFLLNGDAQALSGEAHDLHIAQHQAILDDPTLQAKILKEYGTEVGEALILRIIKHIEEHKNLDAYDKRAGRVDWDLEPEEVWIRYLSCRDVVMDPDASCFEEARWVAQRSVVPWSSIKNDPAYSKAATREIEGGTVSKHLDGEGEDAQYNKPRTRDFSDADEELIPGDKMVEKWEIWDKKTFHRYVVCPQVKDKFLIKSPTPFARMWGFFPFIPLVFKSPASVDNASEARRAYGMSLMAAIWGEQIELNKMINIQHLAGKMSINKFLGHPSINKKVWAKLAKADMGDIVVAEGAAQGQIPDDIQRALVKVEGVGTTIDINLSIQNLRNEILFKLGLDEILLGYPSNNTGSGTATEAQLKAKSSSAILDDKSVKIDDALLDLAWKVADLAIQFYSTDRAVSVAGEAGESWDLVRGADALGKVNRYDIIIKTGPQAAAMNALDKNQLLQFGQLAMSAGLAFINPEELLKRIGEEAYDIPRDDPIWKTREQKAAEAQVAQAAAAQATLPAQGQPTPGAPAQAPQVPQADDMGELLSGMGGAVST